MSEEKRPIRTEYRASVESGLKRLESEKLSFLGESGVISKFDPGTMEAYSQLLGDGKSNHNGEVLTQELPVIEDDECSPNLSDVQPEEDDEDDSHLLDVDRSGLQDENVPTDVQSPSTIAKAIELAMGMRSLEENRDGDRLTTLNFTALRGRETEDEDLDSCETRDIGDVAEQVRRSLGIAEEPEYGPTLDVTDIVKDIRSEKTQYQTATEWKSVRDESAIDLSGVREVSDSQSQDDPDYGETVNLTDVAGDIRQQSSKYSDIEEQKTNEAGVSDIAQHVQIFLEAERRGLVPKASDVEDELETCATTDLGAIAERVREELAKTNELKVGENRGGAPNAQILRPAHGSPKERAPEPEIAIERLKNQGLFEPVPVIHREVDDNLNDIHSLDKVLAPSDMSSWHDGDDFVGEGTIPQDEDAVRELRHAAELVRAAHKAAEEEPKILPIVTANDAEIENNCTIPLEMPDFSAEKDARNTVSDDAEIENNCTIPLEMPDFSAEEEVKKTIDVEAASLGARRRSLVRETVVSQKADDEKRSQIIWYAIIALLLCGILYMLYLTGIFASISPVLDPFKDDKIEVTPITHEVSEKVDPAVAAAAIREARLIVANTMDYKPWIGSFLDKQINLQASPEGRIPYLELNYDVSEDKVEAYKALSSAWRSAGQPERALEFVRSQPSSPEILTYLNTVRLDLLKENPRFLPPVKDLTEDMCDSIDPLGGGSTLTFKLKQNGENIAAFKPLQTRKQSNYRSEIAAWRLCELLECDFSVPWNRPVRIEHAVFDLLFSRSKSKKKASYSQELTDLIWTKADGKTYVYGTLKDWVPDFTRFPIEYTSLWRPWLSQTDYISEYKPIEVALSPLSHNKNTKKLLPEIMEQSKDLTTSNLAAQISEVLVFDYLIGNWDRFSGVGNWWGVNCQFKDGRIVSIDNGAAFPTYSNDKVRDRFLMTERFSAHFIENLRGLDKEKTFEMLFPEPSKHETECFEQFWKQRESVLSRVDKLSEEYGVDKVLSL